MQKYPASGVNVPEVEPVGSPSMPLYYRRASWGVVAGLVLLVLLIAVPNLLLWRAFDRLRGERDKEHLFWLLCQPGYTEQQRSQAFSELLWLGNREWRSARLARLDLTGAQLAGANIQNAHMEGCKLSGADLARAVLRRTQLDQADLSSADLSGADLYEADLLKANLHRAELSGADLRGADMGQANAAEASFVSADMTGARLDLADLSGADLRLAKLIEANLHVANLTTAKLFRTDLSGADLSRANLSNANWWRATGLSPALIAEFTKIHPPASDADETLKQDFQRWLAEQQEAESQ